VALSPRFGRFGVLQSGDLGGDCALPVSSPMVIVTVTGLLIPLRFAA
jgi:hypothetical protein